MKLDTVAIAVPDACSRLIGKRLTIDAWERVRAHGSIPMPDFHLITDIENAPVSGLDATGVQNGFRNGLLRPDMGSWRELPWDEGTATVMCDAYDPDDQPAERAPRWVLRRQLERLAARGLVASGATELEFYLYRTSYEAGARTDYRRLRPAYHRAGDNDLLVDGHLEPFLGDVRRLVPRAGIPLELSQGEGGVGQFEVTLRHAEPLEMADRHIVYKHAVKTIAQRHGLAATFMAKVRDDQAGSSCHVHLSLRDKAGRDRLGGEGENVLSPFGSAFVAGVLSHSPALALLFAPYANSYRRLQPGSWAPATATWGLDNRTALVRICGDPGDRRVEFRLPGADANPYHAFAGLIAAGLAGVDAGLTVPLPVQGDAYAVEAPSLPAEIAEAVALLAASELAERAFGADVRNHLVDLGAHERDVTRREVTDRDRARCFEVA